MSKDKEFEPFEWRETFRTRSVIGVDEVGRGCLAGPVYASAVLMSPSEAV